MLRAECDDGQVSWAMPCTLEASKRGRATRPVFARHQPRPLRLLPGAWWSPPAAGDPKIGASPLGYRIAEQFGLPVVAPGRPWCR